MLSAPALAVSADLHSSMERLKATGFAIIITHLTIFTFQYGEIKRRDKMRKWAGILRFTFQYGEIKSLLTRNLTTSNRLIYIPVWRD